MLVLDDTLLLVIDVQGNLAQAMHGKDVLFKNLGKIIGGFQILGLPVIVTEQIPQKLGPTIPEIAALFDPFEPIPKASFSCCGEDRFMKELKATDRSQVLLAGIEAHVCVYQTAVDLLKLGYEVQVVADCVSSRTGENRSIGVERMQHEGAKLTSAEMALFELLKVAEGEKFRKIIKVVK
jgi:nicotinamidase-related amidase